ncbi:DUF2085 domain-containing protein [Thermomicrobium sp. 4228-Ro]|uniref:DUF2085 domain-containing protein n=1 Tax=Thermomicrobium sp. 4228-Ro TaxID=2993937 RepID=UPI00224965AE|nr:DUF2085 domain-containing protein [Thermomicrobium sp. 4228-Ro]MCX2726896.1 DUF2085 domain-containing protein [Thermomicrobium sp. 4228-Ro]
MVRWLRARSAMHSRLARELALPLALAVLLLALVALWLAGPARTERVTIAALHGLCAQRPSHSFWFGSYRLPFDARMTGIYAGSSFTLLWLAWRAGRASAPPSAGSVVLLASGVAVLAVDGANALVWDLRLPTLYEPHNTVRYVTGAWTGVALGVLLWWVFVSTSWIATRRTAERVFQFGRDLPVLGAGLVAFGWLVHVGPVTLYPIVALGLVAAAVLTLALLAWPFVLLLTGRLERLGSWGDAPVPALLSGCCALIVMALTSSLRFAAEAVLHLPPLS